MNILYHIFALKEYLTQIVGIHYPTEIIMIIIMMMNYKQISISCGLGYNTLMNFSINKIYVWGDNSYGKLGLGDMYFRDSPKELSIDKNIKKIICGYHHTVALTSILGTIYVWGKNEEGQLGLGHKINQSTPQKLTFGDKWVTSVSCGSNHTIALTSDSKIYVWGRSTFGELGLGDNLTRKSPKKNNLLNVKSISCGSNHTIALVQSNNNSYKCYVWGNNTFGQLGLGHTKRRYMPQELDLADPISIACGDSYTIALTHRGIYVWGENQDGQLGLKRKVRYKSPEKLDLSNLRSTYVLPRSTPQEMNLQDACASPRSTSSGMNIKSISCGRDSTFALTTEGEVYVWGANHFKQLGLGDKNNRSRPQKLNLNKSIKSIHCGGYHTMCITVDDKIYEWGSEIGVPQEFEFDNIL